jgi:hypothetical protein
MDFIENPPPLRYREYPEGIDFTVRKSMTLEVNSGRQGAHISYKLKSACPKDSTIDNFYLQDVKDVKIQPEPSTGFPDIRDKTQEIMLWEEDFFYGSKTFILEYTIRTQFFQWDLDEGDSGNIRDIPDTLKQRYNHDEWRLDKDGDGELDDEDDQDGDGEWDYLIEVTNPDIQSRAKDLANGETNVFKIVRNIYDYLTQDGVLNYVTSSTGLPKDCATTYSDKRGDCDDYSILFISLCRALDIPAWLELGVLYDKQNRQWGGHAWSKVAIPLKGGGYAAPSIDIVNKQFMLFDPYRFIEWRDTGGDELYPGETETRNNLDYYYHTFSYQSTGSPQIVSPNTNDFLTLSMNEFGDKKRVAADDDEGLGSLCMLPGFDSSVFVISFIFATLIIAVNKSKFRRKRYL